MSLEPQHSVEMQQKMERITYSVNTIRVLSFCAYQQLMVVSNGNALFDDTGEGSDEIISLDAGAPYAGCVSGDGHIIHEFEVITTRVMTVTDCPSGHTYFSRSDQQAVPASQANTSITSILACHNGEQIYTPSQALYPLRTVHQFTFLSYSTTTGVFKGWWFRIPDKWGFQS